MKIITLILIFSFISTFGFGQYIEATKNYDLGNQFFKLKNYQKAIEFYSVSLKLHSTPDAYFNRAISYIRINDTCNCCNDLESAINYFNDKEAGKYYEQICAKRDTIVETSDSIKQEYPGYSYTVVSKHSCISIFDRNYFDQSNKEIPGKVDLAAEFPGGVGALEQFLRDNIQYPQLARDYKIQGTVSAIFIIKNDGRLSDIKIMRGIGAGCDEEFLRVIRLMPGWKPATRKGVAVDASITLPYNYTLTAQSQKKNPGNYSSENGKASKSKLKNKNTIDWDELANKSLKSFNDSCSYCNELKKAAILHNNAALHLYSTRCCYATIETVIPQSIKQKLPSALHLEILHELFGKDSIIYVVENENGLMVKTEINDIDDPVYSVQELKDVEEIASFPEGDYAMAKFLENNINYPKEAAKNSIQGCVYVTFIVEKDGFLSNVRILKGIGSSCDDEVLRVVKCMPNWHPSKQGGEPIRAWFNLPVQFTNK